MTEPISAADINDTLSDLTGMWAALTDLCMTLPQAGAYLATRKELPPIIAEIFEQAKVASVVPSESVSSDLRWLTPDEVTEPGNYIREDSEELCVVEMAKQGVHPSVGESYTQDALACQGSFYRPDWGDAKFYGPVSLQALLKDRQSITAMTGAPSATEERMKIGWMRPEDAANSLRGELDESGAADGCVVRLDAGHEKHDGGPYLRQAWYDAAQDAFVCSSTGAVLPNVAAWAYDFSEEDEARASVGPSTTEGA